MSKETLLEKEKQCYSYQIEILKDEKQELEERNYRLQKEFREKSRNFDFLSRDFAKLQEENKFLKECVRVKDQIIEENGCIAVTGERAEKRMVNGDAHCLKGTDTHISETAARILSEMDGESLEDKLRIISREKSELLDEIKQLKHDLEEERQRNKDAILSHQMINGIEMQLNESRSSIDTLRLIFNDITFSTVESSKLIHEYKFRLIEAEQDRNNLQNIIMRLETQLERLKVNAEQSEKLENDLKTEKRKVLRELREAQVRIEDLETSNAHLQKRIDKFKSKCLATINSN
ncbi:leucine-rich repeat flightless-interacting protein 2-like protein [Leptotrombidium deliense]|uniref:Leucine-rich repeat flightless-interacting protein 2-like protein n=1 Tax=Leptotrombidium deliense TaxID=299467 RepID=A0A443SP72_9ACAR|nr:leucine-rich repeat flightless-interacting protein 2-like protein [Leptotrombidium deliense]